MIARSRVVASGTRSMRGSPAGGRVRVCALRYHVAGTRREGKLAACLVTVRPPRMPVLALTHARLAFGHHPLLDDADFQLDARERVGLIGRNGTRQVVAARGARRAASHLDDGELRIAPARPHRPGRAGARSSTRRAASTTRSRWASAPRDGCSPTTTMRRRCWRRTTTIGSTSTRSPRLHGELDAIGGWALGQSRSTPCSRASRCRPTC